MSYFGKYGFLLLGLIVFLIGINIIKSNELPIARIDKGYPISDTVAYIIGGLFIVYGLYTIYVVLKDKKRDD